MKGVVIRVEKIKVTWMKIWRSLTAIAFISLLAVITVNLITNMKQQPRIGQSTENTEPEILEQKEQIEFFEARGQRGNLRIRADKHYKGEDDQYHLEGNVEIVFFEKSEGEDIFLHGSEVVYDKDGTRFQFIDKSKVRFKDLNLDVSFLEYDAEKQIFKSQYPIDFTSERLSGSGERVTYSLKARTLKLIGNIHVELMSELSPSFPIILEGDEFTFMKRAKKGKLEGNVRITQGSSWITSESVDFKLTANEENIRTMLFTGNVRASLDGSKLGVSSKDKKEVLSLPSDKREIQAEEVLVQAFLDLPKVRLVSANGGCLFNFIAVSEKLTSIKGKSLEFGLNREGELVQFFANSDAEIAQRDENGEIQRKIYGDTITLEEGNNLVVARGKDPLRANVSTLDSDIKAETITISRKNDNMEANGNVQVIFSTQEEGKLAVGFFSQNKPVFITTEDMRYFAAQKRFNFSGGNKVWQDMHILFAETLNILKDSGRVTAEGKISSTFPYIPKDAEKEERVIITAEKMSYDPDRDIVHYQGQNTLKIENIILKAQSIFIHLEEEGSAIKRVTAIDDVVVTQEQYQGRGQRAVFDTRNETIILTGNPVLIAEEQGRTAGTKLTFFIADGKIVVENKGQERSVTVIKS